MVVAAVKEYMMYECEVCGCKSPMKEVIKICEELHKEDENKD